MPRIVYDEEDYKEIDLNEVTRELRRQIKNLERQIINLKTGIRVGFCKSCGEKTFWGKLKGKPHLFNLDGISHFATCPDADKWRQKK